MIETPFYSFDLDGTLASNRKRAHLRGNDWPAYHAAGATAAVIQPTRELLRVLSRHAAIVINTARPACWRALTEEWLRENEIPFDILGMRASGDASPIICKSATLARICAQPQVHCAGHFDDDVPTLDYLRELGFTVYQVFA